MRHTHCSACRRGASTGKSVPVGDIRISPSPSCNTEFPSIMFTYTLLACPVENAWKCGTNVIVFPLTTEQKERRGGTFLSRRTGQLCRGYSWPGVDGPVVSLCGVFGDLTVVYTHTPDRPVSKKACIPLKISSPVQLLSSHEEGGQRWLTDREKRKSGSWPAVAMETCDFLHLTERSRRMSISIFLFFSFFLSILHSSVRI